MQTAFLERHTEDILGAYSCFDRIIIQDTLPDIAHADMPAQYWKKAILIVVSCWLTCGLITRAAPAKLRVGIFSGEGFPDGVGARPASWYQDELKKLEHEAIVLNADDMSNAERLNRKTLDILILPDGKNVPCEAAYLIPEFLAAGGHLVTTYLPMTGYKSDPSQSSKWTDGFDIHYFRLSWRKYPMTWQIRFLPWKSARRNLNCELKINTNLTDSCRALLPATAGPLNTSMGLPDKLNMFRHENINGEREYRDLNCAGGDNMETAANIILPVYTLPTGESADFLAYRYHNNYYNGATLVHLGQTGESLMKGDKAGEVLQACLKLCAEKYPGEQTEEWYERMINVQRKTSAFGKIFTAAYHRARDAMIAAFYSGERETYYAIQQDMQKMMAGLEAVMQEKQALDKLLHAGTDYAGQDQRRKALLERIAAEEKKCEEVKAAAAGLPVVLKEPEQVKIRHALGRMPAVAGVTFMGLYGLNAMLQAIKESGCNVWLFQKHSSFPFLDSPSVKSLMNGIKIEKTFSRKITKEQGKLDLLSGQVKETRREKLQPGKTEEDVRQFIGEWKKLPMIRYWAGQEGGLGCAYWGSQAREEYAEHLAEKYKNVSRMNERWLTAHTSFNDVNLITQQPQTASEHANWEDWRKFREMQVIRSRNAVYKLFKKYSPDTFFSYCISTGCRWYPFYGVDYYELTKTQDIVGTDGTSMPVEQEWTYLDLIADGKKLWTMEWGAFYFPPADLLVGRKKLARQLWQEVSGGHAGVNCWIWCWPGYPANYVDTTGLPTLYGWELTQLLSDFRRIEHILLDGKRADPEVRILFSNTSRCHDQSWKPWGGTRALSLHLKAVDNLYGCFAKLAFAARVLDEGALRDGADLRKCRILIVPQAQYLSSEIQDKLLDYAKNGGCLVVEGLSGKCDNYGNSSNNMFKAMGIARGMARTKEVQLKEGVIYTARDPKNQELFYAPIAVEGGKTLLQYASGEPAMVSRECGQGKIIVSGLPFSVEQAGIGQIMDKIFSEAGYTPKYKCDDEKLVLREWEYDNELYLICAHPEGKEGKDILKRFCLKLRGDWEVEDYLLGMKAPVAYEGGWTVMEGVILSPGGRVYRLRPWAGHPEKKKAAGKPAKEGEGKQVFMEETGLPYKGEIRVENGEVVLGGYKFQAAVVNEGGSFNEKGRVFLTARKGDEERMQELKTGKDSLFSFRGETLRVKCESQCYVYPEGATVAIEKIERPKIESACGIATNGNALELSNGLVSLTVSLNAGGRIAELKTWPEGINHIFSTGGIKEIDGIYPGNLMNQLFTVKGERVGAEKCVIEMEPEKTVNGLREKKEIALTKNIAGAAVKLELKNEGEMNWQGMFRVHPELTVGGMADGGDVFYVPVKDALNVIHYAVGEERLLIPSEGWTACCDSRERIAYVSVFSLNEVKTVYLFFGNNCYNIELWGDKGTEIKKGASLRLDHEIYMIKGVSGVGGYGKGWAGNIIMSSDKWTQDKTMKIKLELGNAYFEKQSAPVRMVLMKEGREIRRYYEGKAEVSYENPAEKEIEAGFDGLGEGEYELRLEAGTDAEKIFSIGKKITLAGKKLEEDRAMCQAYQKRLDACLKGQNLAKERKFNAVQFLEELKTAVEEQDDAIIRQKRGKLESVLGGLNSGR